MRILVIDFGSPLPFQKRNKGPGYGCCSAKITGPCQPSGNFEFSLFWSFFKFWFTKYFFLWSFMMVIIVFSELKWKIGFPHKKSQKLVFVKIFKVLCQSMHFNLMWDGKNKERESCVRWKWWKWGSGNDN